MTYIKNEKLHEQRAQIIGRREDKKIVSLLLENHNSTLMPSQENNSLEPEKNINSENIDDIKWHQPEHQYMKIPSSDVGGFYNLDLKV